MTHRELPFQPFNRKGLDAHNMVNASRKRAHKGENHPKMSLLKKCPEFGMDSKRAVE